MRTRDGKPLVRHYLSEWGHDYRTIQSWRDQHGDQFPTRLVDFFAAHGVCGNCAGAGIEIVEEGDEPLYDLCPTCDGTGRAERSKWTNRSRQIYVRSRGGLLPYHSHESHGFSIQSIKEWRSVRHDAGQERSLRDFYVAHGLCPECRGEGVQMDGKGELTPQEKAERPWHDPEDEYPFYALCPSCRGSGKMLHQVH